MPYEIKSGDFSSSQTTAIKNGIATLNNSTNMNLKTRTDKDKDYVLIAGDNNLVGSGQSSVGRQSGRQKLTLNTSKKRGGISEGTIQHEFMHAFGFNHDLVDISPYKDQGYLRLIVNLANGELQHMRPQSATALDNMIYYERAQYTGRNIFDAITGLKPL